MANTAKFGPNTVIAVGATDVVLSDDSVQRRYLLIQNNGPGNLFLNFGEEASASNGLKIESGKAYEPAIIPEDTIHGYADQANTSVVVVEA